MSNLNEWFRLMGMVGSICIVTALPERSCGADALSAQAETTHTTNTVTPPPRRDVPGQRFELPMGQLYVPDYYRRDATMEIVVFFHGAAWCAEQTFYDVRKNAALVTVNGVQYESAFRQPEAFAGIIAAATGTLEQNRIAAGPLGKLCVASFSAGYAAVRDILRQPHFVHVITDVVLADSLYAPRVKGATHELEPAAMQPFLDYARRAAAGECGFWFSQLFPPEEIYRDNTTTLAAYYLTDRLGIERRPSSGRSSRGAAILYRAERMNFHVLGYAGMTNQDHADHFYAWGDLLRETSLMNVESIMGRFTNPK